MEESEAESYSLQTILAYVGMTVMVVVLAGWVMGNLGKWPLVVTAEQTTLPAGWTAVTDAGLTFTLNLPADWNWQEAGEDGENDLYQAIIEEPLRPSIMRPFGKFDQNLQLLLLAADSSSSQAKDLSGYLIIARDLRPQPLTRDDARFLLAEFDDTIELLRTEHVDGVRGELQADFLVRVVNDVGETALRCQQKVIIQTQGNFLLAACALPDIYPSLSTELHNILASFQPLS